MTHDLPDSRNHQRAAPFVASGRWLGTTFMDNKTIKVWKFEDAPKEYRDLSTNGGDEDWIAFVPAALSEDWIGWLESGSPFGCCCVDEYKVEGGVIRIGCHS
jgi:hypothetical protein